jgi:membrane protein DedA with SNARE-associated domain
MDNTPTAPAWLAWGAPIVSVVVLLTFGGVVSLTMLRTIPTGSETVLNVLLGTLAAMATNVVGYWVGSSAGSARKDERLAEVARAVKTTE